MNPLIKQIIQSRVEIDSAKLSEAMKQNGITLSALCERTGLTKPLLCGYMNGTRPTAFKETVDRVWEAIERKEK